ncbi:MAG: NAD(P)/FAD-dependent oxidoreductase [Bacilli bacterium]|nr:NAD(P)/FAD-dependent oxidoreductase [Bacilli bacterium]
MEDIIIIGGGVIGAFVARYLSRYKTSILVLDKETDVGDVTSMANSAIGHSGYDPVPGTKKAYFNVKGNKMYPEVCKQLDVHFDMCGSLTVALDDKQFAMLGDLKKRAEQNGVETKLLTGEEVKAMEPNVSQDVKGALLCPTAGVVNPFTLTVHAMENAVDNGAKLQLGCEVLGIDKTEKGYVVHTNLGDYEARLVINCAGLFSDKIAAMIEDIDWSIRPRKGEYYVLDHYAKGLVNHVLFPLPSEKGKGILVTMTTSGNYLVGPSSEWVDDKEDYATDTLTLANVKAQATMMVPNIPFREQIRVFSGLRATPSTHDFIIEKSHKYDTFVNVAGIESPGLASSPAIGQYVADELVAPTLGLELKEQWNPCVKPYVKPADMELEERNALIAKNPHFGKMVCNCEKVSLGEIEDALSRSVPPHTIKALKKRTRAGFGKCQGGFCQPQVLLLLAEHYGISPLDVLYDKEGSNILEGVSK